MLVLRAIQAYFTIDYNDSTVIESYIDSLSKELIKKITSSQKESNSQNTQFPVYVFSYTDADQKEHRIWHSHKIEVLQRVEKVHKLAKITLWETPFPVNHGEIGTDTFSSLWVDFNTSTPHTSVCIKIDEEVRTSY